MVDSLAAVLRSLLFGRSTAALATIHEGRPAVSMIPFAVYLGPAGLRLVAHVSGLAAHTRDMRSSPEVCLLVAAAEAPGTMPQELARVSITARAEFIGRDHADRPMLERVYLERFPDAAGLFQLGDFSIVVFEPEAARLVAGFARAVTIPPAALADALAGRA